MHRRTVPRHQFAEIGAQRTFALDFD